MQELKNDKSDLMEVASDIATAIVIQRFGEDTFIDTDEGTIFAEEPQDFFNDQYDWVETQILKLLNR